MRIELPSEMLADAVAWVARSLPTRPPVPVLGGILLSADPGGSLTLSGHDLETSSTRTVAAEVAEGGDVLLHGRLLADLTRSLPPAPVRLDLAAGTLRLVCGATRFTLPGMPRSEYPAAPSPGAVTGTIPADLLARAVSQVALAADRGPAIPVLTGVLVEVEGGRWSLAATDKYRLALRDLAWDPASDDVHGSWLVPARAFLDGVRALGSGRDVHVSLGSGAHEGLLGLRTDDRRVTLRLLDGAYPKVAGVVPRSVTSVAVARTAELIDAVRRVALVAERNAAIRLRIEESQVAVEAGEGEAARGSETVHATLRGPSVKVALSATLLLDGLGALPHPYARLAFSEAPPVVISGQREADGDADEDYRYVMMPIRVPR